MNSQNNSKPSFGWEKLNVNFEENKRAFRRRNIIIWLFIAWSIFLACLGVYFGFFAAKIGG